MDDKKLNILFICTANVSRSQMAEGWAEKLIPHCIEAFSAGARPAARVSSRAVKVMAEVGVDISDYQPKHIDDLRGLRFDHVITLCKSADQFCPTFIKDVDVIHCPIEDPAAFIGTTEQSLEKFRQVRDQIRNFVETLPELFKDQDH